MVDRAARDQYAELLRHFASGRMTNREYDDRTEEFAFESEDRALRNVWTAVWGLYDDMSEHRMTGRHHLTGEVRRDVCRAILFLYTDQEYSWPDDSRYCIANLLSGLGFVMGLFSIMVQPWLGAALVGASVLVWSASHFLQNRHRRRTGDDDAWPFLSFSDLDDARRRPRLLAGVPGNGSTAGYPGD